MADDVMHTGVVDGDQVHDETSGGDDAPQFSMESFFEAVPDDLRGQASLSSFKTPADLAKSYIEGQKMIGHMSGGKGDPLFLPGADASDDDKNAFWGRLGVPDDPSGYDLKDVEMPEGISPNKDLEAWFVKAAHANRIPAGSAKGLYNAWNELLSSQMDEMKAASTQKTEEVKGELRRAFGNAVDDKINKASNVAYSLSESDDMANVILDALGQSAEGVKFLARIADELSEDTLKGAQVARGTDAITPQVALERANAIMSDASHPYHDASHPQHDEAVRKVERYFQAAYPDEG